jgi:hypothetical protein
MTTTNVPDRYRAWLADPALPGEVTMWDAFAEGFIQAMESGHDRVAAPGENGVRPGGCYKCGAATGNAVGLCADCVTADRDSGDLLGALRNGTWLEQQDFSEVIEASRLVVEGTCSAQCLVASEPGGEQECSCPCKGRYHGMLANILITLMPED